MNILIVDDESRLADFISRGLKAEGWAVEHAADGETALEYLRDDIFDIILLDLMLPGISGQTVCRKIRARNNFTPVLMLTALDEKDERITGLQIGADDYLTKPFDFDELVARIDALVRRAQDYRNHSESADVISYGEISLNTLSHIVQVDGETIEMTAREREVLLLLLSNPNKVFARERILNRVWGCQADPLTNVVDVFIGRLRKKLGAHGRLIKTVRGLGYRFGE